jgi:hypothetical protein
MVRVAAPDDANAVARLLVQVQSQHVRDYPSIFRPMTEAEAAEAIGTDLQAGAYAVRESASVDGFVKWVVHDRPENPFLFAVRSVIIDQIGVDSQARRRGIVAGRGVR